MMKNVTALLLQLSVFATIISCRHEYNLKKGDRNYIPYKGNEVLVFQSDKNRTDTIFLTGIGNGSGCAGSQALFPDKCEGINISCIRTDPNYDRYLDGKQLVEVTATPGGETRISFDIVLKGSWFYASDSYTLSEFESMPSTYLMIENETYKDVKIIEADDYAKQFQERDNYAERFYWSVGSGFLGLDRRDEKWRLTKIYTP